MKARALLWTGVALVVAVAAISGLAPFAPAPVRQATEVAAQELPAEARETLALIRKGGPFESVRDGTTFGNREGRLPARAHGYYREYTVRTPGERTRGARRIVAGQAGDYWYTDDHYGTFRQVRE